MQQAKERQRLARGLPWLETLLQALRFTLRTLRRVINLDGTPATVVGVLPETFDFGAVFSPGAKPDAYMPVVMDDIRDQGNTLALVGRLKPGVRSLRYAVRLVRDTVD